MNRMHFLLLTAAFVAAAGCSDGPSSSDYDGDCDGGDCECECGPCASVANGEWRVTTVPWLDLTFKAVVTLGDRIRDIEKNHRASLERLADAFGVNVVEDMPISDLTAQLKAAIENQITAGVDGDLLVSYRGGLCYASTAKAAEILYHCEKRSGCDITDDSETCGFDEIAVLCEGKCVGGCSATCNGSCGVQLNGSDCAGECYGTCLLSIAATCDDTCIGQCAGQCSLVDPGGDCHGSCGGDCAGLCDIPFGGSCAGSCEGWCVVETSSEECEGECIGSCEGECTGGCYGPFETPSCCDIDCVATADCARVSALLARVSPECREAQLSISYDLDGSADDQTRQQTTARLHVFEREIAIIATGSHELQSLISPSYAAEFGVDTPIQDLNENIITLIAMNFDEAEIPDCMLPCLIPALDGTANILMNTVTDSAPTLQSQLEMMMLISL
jgi:hypothetical protein